MRDRIPSWLAAAFLVLAACAKVLTTTSTSSTRKPRRRRRVHARPIPVRGSRPRAMHVRRAMGKERRLFDGSPLRCCERSLPSPYMPARRLPMRWGRARRMHPAAGRLGDACDVPVGSALQREHASMRGAALHARPDPMQRRGAPVVQDGSIRLGDDVRLRDAGALRCGEQNLQASGMLGRSIPMQRGQPRAVQRRAHRFHLGSNVQRGRAVRPHGSQVQPAGLQTGAIGAATVRTFKPATRRKRAGPPSKPARVLPIAARPNLRAPPRLASPATINATAPSSKSATAARRMDGDSDLRQSGTLRRGCQDVPDRRLQSE